MPRPLNLGWKTTQNTGFAPKNEPVPSPVPSMLPMAGVALRDGDRGMSQGPSPWECLAPALVLSEGRDAPERMGALRGWGL